jgi:hypothetical protein
VLSRMAVALLAVAALVGAVPLGKAALRARERARLRATPRGSIEAAWADAVGVLDLLNVPLGTAATPHELAARAASALGPETAPVFVRLAGITTRSSFAPEEPDAASIGEAQQAADRIRSEITRRVSWKRRVRRSVDPRPLAAALVPG